MALVQGEDNSGASQAVRRGGRAVGAEKPSAVFTLPKEERDKCFF